MNQRELNNLQEGFLGLLIFKFINENNFNSLTAEQVGKRVNKLITQANIQAGMIEIDQMLASYKKVKVKYRRRKDE